jgi:hypothetical protein
MGRVAGWFGAASSGGSSGGGGTPQAGRFRAGGPGAATNGAPDFLAQLEDPDKRRLSEAQSRTRGESQIRSSRPGDLRNWIGDLGHGMQRAGLLVGGGCSSRVSGETGRRLTRPCMHGCTLQRRRAAVRSSGARQLP